MRIFWTILGVLMLLGAGYLFMQPGNPAPEPAPPAPVLNRPLATNLPETPPVNPQPSTSAATPPAGAVNDAKPAESEANRIPSSAPTAAEKPAVVPESVPEKPVAAVPNPVLPVAPPAETPAPAEAPGAANPTPPPPAAPTAPAVVVNPDGTTTVDGKFTFRGKGTQAEPYIITWDQLVSVQEDYAPKDGRTALPTRATVLHDKYVQITGNITFPLMMEEADECLVMLNQWDGCCIGIPPTPYDAIEVKLKKAVTGNDVLTTFGTLTGKLKVDPHLVGGWLVGLYLMEEAILKPEAYGGFAP